MSKHHGALSSKPVQNVISHQNKRARSPEVHAEATHVIHPKLMFPKLKLVTHWTLVSSLRTFSLPNAVAHQPRAILRTTILTGLGPLLVHTSAINLATECVRLILKIDDIVITR